jgi:hypothetical protein
MHYEYNKKCFTFGKIKRIYFFKFTYYVELTNKSILPLNVINISDFINKNDLKVLDEAFLADKIEARIYFNDELFD